MSHPQELLDYWADSEVWTKSHDPEDWPVSQETVSMFQRHLDRLSPLADDGNDAPLVEKLEFTLQPSDLESVSMAEQVVIEVTTLLGTVAKTLSAEEIGAISKFADEARERHDEIRLAAARD